MLVEYHPQQAAQIATGQAMRTSFVAMLAGASIATLVMSATSTAQSTPQATCKTFEYQLKKNTDEAESAIEHWMEEQLAVGHKQFSVTTVWPQKNVICSW